MRIETSFSPALALKAACVGKNAQFRYFKKNVRVKGLKKRNNSIPKKFGPPVYKTNAVINGLAKPV